MDHGGFSPLSKDGHCSYFVRRESKMTDIFFSHRQGKAMNDSLATNDSNSGMDGEKRRKFNQFGISISEAKDGFVLPLFQHNF